MFYIDKSIRHIKTFNQKKVTNLFQTLTRHKQIDTVFVFIYYKKQQSRTNSPKEVDNQQNRQSLDMACLLDCYLDFYIVFYHCSLHINNNVMILNIVTKNSRAQKISSPFSIHF
jgi:hypothetical protein